jgi:glutamate synthase (NADPH/NADH) large chain
MVMSLVSFIGPKPNLLDTNTSTRRCAWKCRSRCSISPTWRGCATSAATPAASSSRTNSNICYPVAWGKEGIEASLASLCAEAVDAVKSGHNILIVSDRKLARTRSPFPRCWPPRPSTSIWSGKGLRASTGLVVETGSARETHHFALLAGYGAEAVHPTSRWKPWPKWRTACRPTKMSAADLPIYNYTKAIGKGLMKVMSKMGISTYMSYCGAQIFEAIGLNRAGGQVFPRHRVERRRHRPVRSGRGSAAPA